MLGMVQVKRIFLKAVSLVVVMMEHVEITYFVKCSTEISSELVFSCLLYFSVAVSLLDGLSDILTGNVILLFYSISNFCNWVSSVFPHTA